MHRCMRPKAEYRRFLQPVGKEATATAGQTLAAALGGGGGGAGQQQISEALAKMTKPQIYEIMSQMKALIQQNPAQVPT